MGDFEEVEVELRGGRSRDDGEDAGGAAGAIFDPEWTEESERTTGGELVEVVQVFDEEDALIFWTG